MFKKNLLLNLLIGLHLFTSGCALILIPKKQKITIQTDNEKSVVYVKNEEVARGKSTTLKIEKKGTQQVVVQTPGYKDEYMVLIPTNNTPAFFPLRICSFLCFVYPGIFETAALGLPKFIDYNSNSNFNAKTKLVLRNENDKYIELDAIKLNIKDSEKDILLHTVTFKEDMTKVFKEADEDHAEMVKKAAIKQAKQDKKKGVVNKLNDGTEEKKITYDDTKFSYNVIKTLKKTGFIDTVNTVFQDNNNTLSIEGSLNKVVIYNVQSAYPNRGGGRYEKAKLNITWKLKNTYGEVIDSIVKDDYSGDFAMVSTYVYYTSSEEREKMFADAIEISFNNIISSDFIKKHLKQEVYSNPKLTNIKLIAAKKSIKEVADATEASVIIKRKDKGHGSGFAISSDGYIITNFHVISDKYFDKFSEIKVILSNGEEVSAKIVRVNREKDLALLKVEHNFEIAFKIEESKSYKKLMEVYTVGTPKSIELGQTVSLGILSNERKVNNSNLLQLSMSVNPGNSGGPLFDKAGNLHGIIQSKLVGYATEGVSFAIPSYLLGDYLNIGY